ncbi:hypothetical protein MLD38_036956 [Melastoma candidum]|uniref:Uncharacterized protein n=1 Tax=Melastoma candidum TaxID=119954 RepID=A0ACB9LLT7_9MYRT|nr:hypothetical protein MLD38_036956 [Melastoma candidum]
MGRSPCCEKNNGVKKGPWTQEEDELLVDYITKHGYGNWRTLPKNAGLQRCGKSCRLRWTNYLRPDIKRGRFSSEEEDAIIHLHSILGNKWSAIAARLPGRTDNEIKNFWNTHIRKRLLRMGIDPVTHCPRLELLDLSSILSSSCYGNRGCGFEGCAPGGSLPRYFHGAGDNRPINTDLLKLATTLFSTQRHEYSSLSHRESCQENRPCEAQVQVDRGHLFTQSQFSGGPEGLQFGQTTEGFSQLEQTSDDWESRSGLYTTSLEEECSRVDFPSYAYCGPWDDQALLQQNIPTYDSYDGMAEGNFIYPCSPTPMNSNSNSNSNSTTTHINGSAYEDGREISYCSGDMMDELTMAPVGGAFDLSGYLGVANYCNNPLI